MFGRNGKGKGKGGRPLRLVAPPAPTMRGPVVRVIERRVIGVFSLSAGAGDGNGGRVHSLAHNGDS